MVTAQIDYVYHTHNGLSRNPFLEYALTRLADQPTTGYYATFYTWGGSDDVHIIYMRKDTLGLNQLMPVPGDLRSMPQGWPGCTIVNRPAIHLPRRLNREDSYEPRFRSRHVKKRGQKVSMGSVEMRHLI
jgi:hypothetical protein